MRRVYRCRAVTLRITGHAPRAARKEAPEGGFALGEKLRYVAVAMGVGSLS